MGVHLPEVHVRVEVRLRGRRLPDALHLGGQQPRIRVVPHVRDRKVVRAAVRLREVVRLDVVHVQLRVARRGNRPRHGEQTGVVGVARGARKHGHPRRVAVEAHGEDRAEPLVAVALEAAARAALPRLRLGARDVVDPQHAARRRDCQVAPVHVKVRWGALVLLKLFLVRDRPV